MSATTARRVPAKGERVWIIEEDGGHTSATFGHRTMFNNVIVFTEDGTLRCWGERNVIDHETTLRLSELRRKNL